MKWWFKVNRNLLYRKYCFDPHNFILKSFKIDKSFKIIVLKKKYIKRKKFRKKFKRLKKFKKKFKIKPFEYMESLDTISLKKKKLLRINFNKNIKKKHRKQWYLSFWNKVKLNYFYNKKRRTKKKFNARVYYKKKKYKFTRRRLKRSILFKISKKKRAKSNDKIKQQLKRRKRLLHSKKVWLVIKKYRRKHKAWWRLRINLRKTAFYYGYKSLRKFRKVNKFTNKAMPILTYCYDKLESMLNIFLLRINFFDNIFISNNFIRSTGYAVINGNVCVYPYTYVKIGQILSFTNIKKMQSIFKKRIYFSKYMYIKNYKKYSKIHSKKLVKIVLNVPRYIHYDYQIMHFCIYRFPNKKEKESLYNKSKDKWALNTRLQYN